MTIEVYIDDMLVKSLKSEGHIGHLGECLKLIIEHCMRLNIKKCVLAVVLGKFMGVGVTMREIETSPE